MAEPPVALTRTALLCDLRQQCTISIYETEEDVRTHKHRKKVKRTESITTTAFLDHNEIDTLIVAAPALSYLSKLTTLLLQNNRLTELPAELWRLSGLQELDVSHNQIETLSPDIGLLSNLRALYIHNNKFTELPTQIGQLRQLVILDVACNRLTTLPSQLKHIRLERLWTSGNPFTAELLWFDTVLPLQYICAQVAGSLSICSDTLQWLPTTVAEIIRIKDNATAPRCSVCSSVLFHPGLQKICQETICLNAVPLFYRACSQSCHALWQLLSSVLPELYKMSHKPLSHDIRLPDLSQHMSRAFHSGYTDEEDVPARSAYMDDTREHATMSLTASPSSSYKMSMDSDDAHSASSLSMGRHTGSSYAYQPTTSLQLSPASQTDSGAQRRPLSRPPSEILTGIINWGNIDGAFRSREETMSDSESSQHSNSATGRVWKHPNRSSRRIKKSPSNDTRQDPVRRCVNRRTSLLPKSKALARVLVQANEDTHPADAEIRREQEATAQIRQSLERMSTDTDSIFFKPQPGPSAPTVTWMRSREMDQSPTMVPYQSSKLNPEIEMQNFQLDNGLSPIHSTFRAVKRKGSEDRLFEPYPINSLKRRAVSPSLSLNNSPVFTDTSSPPGFYTQFASSSSSNGGSAAAKGHQKPGLMLSTSYNLQEASGGISRMTLGE